MKNTILSDKELELIDSVVPPEDLLINNNKIKEELNKLFLQKKQTDKFNDPSIPKIWNETKERFQIDKDVVDVFISNIKVDIHFKKIYSIALLVLLIFQLICMNVIFILKGTNILKYSDTAFNIFIAGTLIEVIALVTIVVRYLFKDNISESLNTVLEKNKRK